LAADQILRDAAPTLSTAVWGGLRANCRPSLYDI
jgi:hypothetical protein